MKFKTTGGCLLVALALSGCSAIQVQRAGDGATTLPDGLLYYLPAKQFTITVPFELENCLVDSDGTPALLYTITPSVTETLVGDVTQAHVIRYSELAGKTKVTGFKIDLFDNGTLKSLNAQVEDRTSQIIASTVDAAASLARGIALGKFYSSEAKSVTQDQVCSKRVLELLADRDGAKQRIDNEKQTDKERKSKAAQVAEAAQAFAEAKVNFADVEKTGTAKEKADARKARAVAEEHLNYLKQELADLGMSRLDKNVADLAAARAALTEKVTIVWQPSSTQLATSIRYPDASWEKLLTDMGKAKLKEKVGATAGEPGFNPLNQMVAKVVLLSSAGRPAQVGALATADNKAEGVVYRQPVSAQMLICAGDCIHGANVSNPVLSQTFLVPQLGALGSLPLKNEVFDKNSLVLSQLADGTLVSLNFNSEAGLEKAAQAAKDASAKYLDTVTNLIKDRRTELDAQRDDRKNDRNERKEVRSERKDLREEGASVRADENASLKDAADRITLMRDVEARRAGELDKVQRDIDRNAKEKQLIDSQIELAKKRKELARELEQ